MFPDLFSLGPLHFKTYGLLVGLGVIVAFQILRRELGRGGVAELHAERFLWIAVGLGILGSRFLYIAAEPGASWSEFFRVWEGGLSFLGGLVLAGTGVWVYIKKNNLPLAAVLDAFSLAMPLGHGIGRIGCVMAGCCWGKPTSLFFGLTFTNPACSVPTELLGIRLHAAQIYETAGLLAIFIVLNYFKETWRGRLLSGYLIGYAVLRFFLEFLRGETSPFPILGLTLMQALSVFILIPAGLLWLKYARRESR